MEGYRRGRGKVRPDAAHPKTLLGDGRAIREGPEVHGRAGGLRRSWPGLHGGTRGSTGRARCRAVREGLGVHGEGLGPRRSGPTVRGEAREECARHCPGSALCAPGRGGDSCAARSPGRGGGSGLCRGWARWFTHGGVPCAGSRLSLEGLKSESERAPSVCSGAELSALSFREKWESLVPEKVAFLRHGVGTVGVSEWVHNVGFANVRCSGWGVLGLPCGSRSESRILEPTGAHLGSQSRLSVRDAENQAAGEGCSVCPPWWGPGSGLRAPQDGLEAPPTPPPPKAPLGGPGLVGLGSSPAGTWLTL